MIASGICGTDKHTFRGEVEQYPGSETQRGATYPLIQGHENVGIVEAVGEGGAYAGDGTPLEPGDRVVPAPNRACGTCGPCQRGFPYYLCDNLDSYGNALAADVAPHLFGGWAQYLYLKPRTRIFRVPDALPDDVAVLTEIFAVTHSLERAAQVPSPSGFRPGDTRRRHRRRRARPGARDQGAADGRGPRVRDRPVAEAARRRRAGRRRRARRRRRAPQRRPRGQRHRLPRLVRRGDRDGARRRHDHRGRRVREHGGGDVQPRRAVRAQPHAAGDRRRGPARLRPHARADGPPRGQRSRSPRWSPTASASPTRPRRWRPRSTPSAPRRS